MTNQEAIIALHAAIQTLGPRDRDFAQSLLDQWDRRGLSDKQMAWVHRLATPKPIAVAVPQADLSPILALFATARDAGMKRPSIRFATADESARFRLTVAGSASSAPGSINVTSAEGGFEGRTWFGRIRTDGTFEPTRSSRVDPLPVAAALACFAADPAGQAADYGRRSGECSFCSKELTDAVSIEVGYGPICARKWSLPHRATGLRPAKAA